ncbi:hypothetical protein TIFTF001_044802 [Ficus carica]|uniref:Uncharacterized protein n=1 Tax=Ficus carica TaxID=3494 RepID=A0AA87ZHT2_FICCA|nr:hypothetical protein TIFTF001_044802 [Ficus carica]
MASSSNLCSSVGTETPMQDRAVDSAVDHKGCPAWRSDSDERHGRILRWRLRSCLGHGSGSCFETGLATKVGFQDKLGSRSSFRTGVEVRFGGESRDIVSYRVRVRFWVGLRLSFKIGLRSGFEIGTGVGFLNGDWGQSRSRLQNSAPTRVLKPFPDPWTTRHHPRSDHNPVSRPTTTLVSDLD